MKKNHKLILILLNFYFKKGFKKNIKQYKINNKNYKQEKML